MSNLDATVRLGLLSVLSALLLSAFFQIGQSPRQAAPEIAKQMENAVRELHTPMSDMQAAHAQILRDLAALRMERAVEMQHITDLEKRIDIHRAEIDSMDTNQLAERTVKIEQFIVERQAAEKEAREASKTWQDRMINIGNGIFLLLFGTLANAAFTRWRDRKRRHILDGVGGRLTGLESGINDVRIVTNGLTDKLGKAEGKLEESAEQHQREHEKE